MARRLSVFTRVVKETGARACEIYQLKWTDIDSEANTINITPEKGSRPRKPRLSNNAIAGLMALRYNPKVCPRNGIHVFHVDDKNIEEQYQNFYRNFSNKE